MRTISTFRAMLILTVLSTIPTFSFSETRVSGNIQGEWTPEGNPYIVTGELTITQGNSLQIQPGTIVHFNSWYTLNVLGMLTAVGTPDARITIDGTDHTRWGGIRFYDSADDRSIISFANISDGWREGQWDRADTWGGALYISACNMTVSDCIFDNNSTTGMGGTIFVGVNARPIIERCTIQNSNSTHGSVTAFQALINFNENVIRRCTGTYVAGICLMQSQGSTLSNNRFIENTTTANNWGSCIYFENGSTAVVTNNIFAHNQHGVIFVGVNCSSDRFDHNTIAYNSGHSAVLAYGGRVTITNSILWENNPAFHNEGQISVTYSDVQYPNMVQPGAGCISENPRFLNPDNDDFTLLPGSPCIDAGDPNSTPDPDGSRANMGYIPPFTITLDVAPEELNFGPVPLANEVVTDVWLKYTSDAEDAPDLRFLFQPGEGNYWIGVDPEEAELSVGDSTSFEVIIFCPPRFRLGDHEGEVRIFMNENEEPSIVIPVSITVVDGIGSLTGIVFDQQSGDPISDLEVELVGAFRSAFTDENGRYTFDPLPAWNYTIGVIADGFLPYESDAFEVAEDEAAERNVPLLYAACEPDQDDMEIEVRSGELTTDDLILSNRGSGTTIFTAIPMVPGLVGVEPYDSRLSIPIEELTEDSRIQGVAFANDRIYVSGGNSGNGRGKVYVLDREGNLEGSFDQFVNSVFGYRDLAFDGELLWGIDGENLYGFTPEGELIQVIRAPLNSARAIAYDPDQSLLWMSAVTNNIYGVDSEGNVVSSYRNPGLRIYGMAWYPEDPDGSKLYLYANDANNACFLKKMHTESGEVFPIRDMFDGTLNPSGCEITNQWDPLSWVFIGVTKPAPGNNFMDGIEIIHLDGRSDWIDVQPREGEIEPGASLALEVSVDASNLPNGNHFQAEVAVQHNARGDDFIIPIGVSVRDDAGLMEREFSIPAGINLVSFNVQPQQRDIRMLFAPMVEAGWLTWMKDQLGRFYIPGLRNFSNIPEWNSSQGYLFSTTSAYRLNIEGRQIPATRAIPLRCGWQIVAYYPQESLPAAIAFADVADDLLIAKDALGRFYSPAWGYSNLGLCAEGKGYKVLMNNDCNLIWNRDGEADSRFSVVRSPEYYAEPSVTGSDMSLLVTECGSLSGEIGVYVGELLVGAGVIEDGICGIAVRGATEEGGSQSGAVKGDPLTLRLKTSKASESALEVEVIAGSLTYDNDAFTAVKLSEAPLPVEFKIESVYPNPFNSSTRISFSVGAYCNTPLRLAIYDLSGREVADLLGSTGVSAGRVFHPATEGGATIHSVVWDASASPAGLYFVRMKAGSMESSQRLVIIK